MKATKAKEKKAKSWREAIAINLRAYKLMYDRFPKMIISHILRLVWSALTPYVGIYLSALLIDELSGARNTERLQLYVILILASSIFISLVSSLIGRWGNAYDAAWWNKIEQIYSEKLLDMDFCILDDTKTAEKISLIRQNQNSGFGLMTTMKIVESLISHVLTILGGITLTISLFTSRVPEDSGAYTMLNNPLFILAVIAVMLAITYTSPYFSNKVGAYQAAHADDNNQANRLFGFYGYLGYRNDIAADVRIYRQDRICEKYNDGKSNPFGPKGIFARYHRRVGGVYYAASAAISVIFTGVVYLFVCLKAWAGAYGLGAVTQYVGAVTKVSGGVSGLVGELGMIRNNAAFLDIIFDFLDTPNIMYRGSLTTEKRRDRNYEVEFRNVSFKYPGSDNYALRNVNIKFKIGGRLAVVGMNGSGKTTFIKLLCRLYDPTEGEIMLNGIDIRKYNYAEYMSIFSVVFQDFRLLSLKISENVGASGNPVSALVIDCLKKAGFGDRLEGLEHGIDTYINKDFDGDGIGISGGEAQKIAIARSLYKDAPFIILDEPTASLDPIAEADIYEKFDGIAGDKTAIYISHRLSSCKFCDEIAVFHDGSVIEHGTHDGLLASDGKYHELWEAQAQYYTK